LVSTLNAKEISHQLKILGINSDSKSEFKVLLTLSSIADDEEDEIVSHGHAIDHIGHVSWKGVAEASQILFLLGECMAVWGRSNGIDVILGASTLAGCYYKEYCWNLGKTLEVRFTIFGWTVRRAIAIKATPSQVFHASFVEEKADAIPLRFWEVEDLLSVALPIIAEEATAVDIFRETT